MDTHCRERSFKLCVISSAGKKGIGLSETELSEGLDRLRELHILPEDREQREIETDR